MKPKSEKFPKIMTKIFIKIRNKFKKLVTNQEKLGKQNLKNHQTLRKNVKN